MHETSTAINIRASEIGGIIAGKEQDGVADLFRPSCPLFRGVAATAPSKILWVMA